MSFHESDPDWIKPKNPNVSSLDLLSSDYVGFDSHGSKGTGELGMAGKYTTTPIRINQ